MDKDRFIQLTNTDQLGVPQPVLINVKYILSVEPAADDVGVTIFLFTGGDPVEVTVTESVAAVWAEINRVSVG